MLPPHILFLPNWYPNAKQPNLARFFQDQISLLAKSGVRVGVVVSEDLSLRYLELSMLADQHFQTRVYEENGVCVYRQHSWHLLPSDNLLAARIWIEQMQRLIDRYIAERGKPDILHALVSSPAGYAAQIAAQHHQLPYVITEHSSMYLQDGVQAWKFKQLRSAFGSAAAVAAVSAALATAIEPYTKETPTVIPNFIDTDFFTLPPTARATSPFVFLAAGNLVPVKGYDILLHAFAALAGDHAALELRIAGSGPELGVLQELALQMGVEKQVIFTGQLSPREIRQEMWKANALVVSSRHETFSIVLIEALATGLPVVSTRAGGPEGIVSAEVGVLVPPEDASALAEGMRRVMATSYDPTLLRNYAVRNYSPKAVIDQLDSFYARALRWQPRAEQT